VLTHDASLQRHIGRTLLAPVVIGRRVFVGAGAIILPGSQIGEESIIAAGAVVRGDIPPRSVVTGIPGRVVSDLDSLLSKHREAAREAPRWPHQGWTLLRGITKERRQQQRETLAGGVSGYLDWPHRPLDEDDSPTGVSEQPRTPDAVR
jgi:maltose O-acetyltransferase